MEQSKAIDLFKLVHQLPVSIFHCSVLTAISVSKKRELTVRQIHNVIEYEGAEGTLNDAVLRMKKNHQWLSSYPNKKAKGAPARPVKVYRLTHKGLFLLEKINAVLDGADINLMTDRAKDTRVVITPNFKIKKAGTA